MTPGQAVRGAVVRHSRDALELLFVVEPLDAWAPTFNHLSRLSSAPKHHLADPALAARLLGVDAGALLRGEGNQIVARWGRERPRRPEYGLVAQPAR
jgi:hypothetical protein